MKRNRILIIGAGVLGSNLAHMLSKAHDVTLLVRENSKKYLKENGLIIKHRFKGKTVDYLSLITELSIDDIYDAVFVTLRYSQLDGIIPTLTNNKSKTIVFIGNNVEAKRFSDIPGKDVFFGFFSAAGKKENGVVYSICMKKINVGRIDGSNESDPYLKSIFKKTGIKPIIENRMDDWLKSHAAAVLPLVYACYKAKGNLRNIKKDKAYSLKIMDAIIEGYDALLECGYSVLPKGEYENCTKKKGLCAFIYRFMFSNSMGEICLSDHAMHAYDEFSVLARDFEKLFSEADIVPSVYYELKKDFDNANGSQTSVQ